MCRDIARSRAMLLLLVVVVVMMMVRMLTV